MPKRVFVSFDYDYDKTLKDFLIGQAKNPDSPFEGGVSGLERQGAHEDQGVGHRHRHLR